MLALIGSLGAPQGGDVPRTHEQAAHAEAMKPLIHGFTWFLEHLVAILKFPMAGLSEPLPAFHAAWILNSVIWACFVLMLAKLAAKFWQRKKRPNSRRRQRPRLVRPLLTHRSRQPSVVPRRSVGPIPAMKEDVTLYWILFGLSALCFAGCLTREHPKFSQPADVEPAWTPDKDDMAVLKKEISAILPSDYELKEFSSSSRHWFLWIGHRWDPPEFTGSDPEMYITLYPPMDRKQWEFLCVRMAELQEELDRLNPKLKVIPISKYGREARNREEQEVLDRLAQIDKEWPHIPSTWFRSLGLTVGTMESSRSYDTRHRLTREYKEWSAFVKTITEMLYNADPPNQPPLRMPVSGTPAADAPVAPPPGIAGR